MVDDEGPRIPGLKGLFSKDFISAFNILSTSIRKYDIVLCWLIFNHHRGTEITESLFLFTHRETPEE